MAYARLKLYGVLEELGERVLYYDTDGDPEPETGPYLSQLADELKASEHIPYKITRDTKTKNIETKRMKKDYPNVYNLSLKHIKCSRLRGQKIIL